MTKQDPPLPPARADGRPLFYDVAAHQRCQCVRCLAGGIQTFYPYREVFMNDPANPLEQQEPGSVNTVCKNHVPDNAVIYCPWTNECRNRDDSVRWTEE